MKKYFFLLIMLIISLCACSKNIDNPTVITEYVEIEKIVTVPYETIIEKEVPIEVIKEVPIEVIKEVEVIKEIFCSHSNFIENEIIIQPSCNQIGVELKKCIECNNYIEYTYLDKTSHMWATSLNNGYIHKLCLNCSYSNIERMSPIKVKVNISKSSSILLNGKEHWTKTWIASGSGGYGSYQYSFLVYKPDSSLVASLSQDWSNKNEFKLEWNGNENHLQGWKIEVLIRDTSNHETKTVLIME